VSYITIQPSTKAAAVKRFWQTNNLKATAAEFGVARSTLYEWVRLAEAQLEKAFLGSTPGRRTSTPEEENRKLREQIREVIDVYHKSSQGPAASLSSSVAACPFCGAYPCVRNGRVSTRRQGVRQRLLCPQCRRSTYVEVKKTL